MFAIRIIGAATANNGGFIVENSAFIRVSTLLHRCNWGIIIKNKKEERGNIISLDSSEPFFEPPSPAGRGKLFSRKDKMSEN